MICKFCGKNSQREDVCTNCGVVYNTHTLDYSPVKRLDKKSKEKKYNVVYKHPLSPDIGFFQKYPKHAKNPELNRALKRQKKEKDNRDRVDYVKAYQAIKLIGDSLQLPKNIIMETINIYRCVKDKDDGFFRKYKLKPSYIAFIKISCQLNDFYIGNDELIEYADYCRKNKRLRGYMDKKFNKAYIETKKLLNIQIDEVKHPSYIDYVANKLELPYSCCVTIHRIYDNIRKYTQSQYKIEGYILALYYIKFSKKYKLSLSFLEKMMKVSRITISSRRDEILRMTKK